MLHYSSTLLIDDYLIDYLIISLLVYQNSFPHDLTTMTHYGIEGIRGGSDDDDR